MKSWKIALVVLALILAGCAGDQGAGPQGKPDVGNGRADSGTQASNAGTTDTDPELPTVTIHASSGKKVRVHVEIADNPIGRALGLRGRESLPYNQGMLFVYTEEQSRSFTMADTLIPLSIAFLDSEERIIDLQDMKPRTPGPYVSAEPAQYALEVNQGFFEEKGVKVGDHAVLPE